MQRSLQRLYVVGREQFHAPHKVNVDGVNRGTTLSGVQLRAPREGKVDDAGLVPLLNSSYLSDTTYQLHRIHSSIFRHVGGVCIVLEVSLTRQEHSLAELPTVQIQ